MMEQGQTFEQIIVNGGSMRPFLRHGQFLLLEKRSAEEIRPGDIVIFKIKSGRLRVHRVRRIVKSKEGVRLLMRGDNVGHNDGFIDFSQVLGVAEARVKGGVAIKFTRFELSAGLLLAPLLYQARHQAIFVLALCMRFMYSFISIKKTHFLDGAGGICRVYSWLGRPVCQRRSSGRTWVHPVFAKTSILSEIMQEQQ